MKKHLILTFIVFVFFVVFLLPARTYLSEPCFHEKEVLDPNQRILIDNCPTRLRFDSVFSIYPKINLTAKVSYSYLVLELIGSYLLTAALLRIFRRKENYGKN